tara:strand:- start:284 stop:685 length:402 start_codon:yes stop_codon:yes gene_type:complete
MKVEVEKKVEFHVGFIKVKLGQVLEKVGIKFRPPYPTISNPRKTYIALDAGDTVIEFGCCQTSNQLNRWNAFSVSEDMFIVMRCDDSVGWLFLQYRDRLIPWETHRTQEDAFLSAYRFKEIKKAKMVVVALNM